MKLRIKGNSIRLRLGKSEVLRLASDETVEESTAFGPSNEQRLSYALCTSREASSVSASFAGQRIVISVPRSLIQKWVSTDQVSIQASQRTGNDRDLRILIEKDFECIDTPADESQEDAFPNPHIAEPCQPAPAIERSE